MKNVHIYNIVSEKERYPKDILLNYLRAQIDNSLRLGWEERDIIIGTNFDFEYNGVKSIKTADICSYNIFNNKWYGMRELVKEGVLEDEFWFHDQDSWQVEKFEFPFFLGSIGGCKYVFTDEWNTSSIFVNEGSLDVLDSIVNVMEEFKDYKTDSDENFISYIRKRTSINEHLSTLTNEYNVGKTKFESRYNNAILPVYICGFKPHLKEDCTVFEGNNDLKVNLIDNDLRKIFIDHNIYYKNA